MMTRHGDIIADMFREISLDFNDFAIVIIRDNQ